MSEDKTYDCSPYWRQNKWLVEWTVRKPPFPTSPINRKNFLTQKSDNLDDNYCGLWAVYTAKWRPRTVSASINGCGLYKYIAIFDWFCSSDNDQSQQGLDKHSVLCSCMEYIVSRRPQSSRRVLFCGAFFVSRSGLVLWLMQLLNLQSILMDLG